MKGYFSVLLAVVVLAGGVCSTGYAAEKHKSATDVELLDKVTMQTLAKSATPDSEVRVLAILMGAWDFDLKYWSKRDAEPQLSNGTADNELIFGGRFLSSKIMTTLNIGGQNIPYQGLSLLGYDAIRKSYTAVLADTMHAGITSGAGQYNEKTQTLEEKGTFSHPLIGKERNFRAELKLIGDGYTQAIFIPDSTGAEFKVLELDYHRKR